jgi:hypothetical protein
MHLTVRELIQRLEQFPQDLPVRMSMNGEYDSGVYDNFIELVEDKDLTAVYITDTPGADREDDYNDVDEAQEWHDFDPDC